MGRHKDCDWNLPTSDNGALKSWDYVPMAILMDIRDELKRLNMLLHCDNFVRIPRKLEAIRAEIRRTKPARRVCDRCDKPILRGDKWSMVGEFGKRRRPAHRNCRRPDEY